MSGVQRFLSRRGRNREIRKNRPTQEPDNFDGLFIIDPDSKAKHDKEEDRRVEGILERLRSFGIDTFVESNVRYALRVTHNHGDGDAAFRVLMLLQETSEGVLKSYEPGVKLLGAVNRESVTCYLDSLLFSMFARLDSFEAMLYDNFEDGPRRQLASALRLWVNMLRTGRLITVDITKRIQEILALCGWEDAGNLRQQDPSEAFTFITGQLELPLLTLKMDLYHTGKEDPHDDHKFVNERLLEVAILDEPVDGRQVITLEDCLEHYFNNRIEIRRHLENQRRHTLKSGTSNPTASPTKMEKESGIHIETVELSSPDASLTSTPTVESMLQFQTKNPVEKLRPSMSRQRADSIFSQRKVEATGISGSEKSGSDTPHGLPERKLSTRTEVLMPAWQFFQLLPWYTDHLPTSDAQVAAHFSRKRPVLGICLKRYSYTTEGEATRLNTYIDIPLEIAVPNFVSDEHMQDDGPLVGNFRLLLQAVVCHRGVSVHSGHYISLARMNASEAPALDPESRRSSESGESGDTWVRFDDLAKERISRVDIREALKQETPYLLFYQVQPVDEAGFPVHDLPTYAEATSRSTSEVHSSDEKPYLDEPPGSETALHQIPSNTLSQDSRHGPEVTDFALPADRPSLDVCAALENPRGRSSYLRDGRRGSVPVNGRPVAGSISGGSTRTDNTPSIPSTPSEEKNGHGFLGIAGKIVSRSRSTRVSRGSKDMASRSRPSSAGPTHDNASRFSLSMTRISQKVSRGESQPPPPDRPSTGEEASRREQSDESAGSGGQPPNVVVAGDDRPSIDTAKPMPGAPPSHATFKKDRTVVRLGKRAKGFRGNDEEDRECVLM